MRIYRGNKHVLDHKFIKVINNIAFDNIAYNVDLFIVDVKPKEGAVGDRAVFKGVMIQIRDSRDHLRGHLPRKRELRDEHFEHACHHRAVTHRNDEDKVHARQIVFRLNRQERHMDDLQCV